MISSVADREAERVALCGDLYYFFESANVSAKLTRSIAAYSARQRSVPKVNPHRFERTPATRNTMQAETIHTVNAVQMKAGGEEKSRNKENLEVEAGHEKV